MSHWCEMPAPNWARALAAEAIRERDCLQSVVFPPTPRDEERDDLVYWLRAAEWFCDAVGKGWVERKEWTYWRGVFESLPAVDSHFRVLLAAAQERRRLRREYARAEAATRKALDLAKTIGAIPADPRRTAASSHRVAEERPRLSCRS
jgi:hypothetical protein